MQREPRIDAKLADNILGSQILTVLPKSTRLLHDPSADAWRCVRIAPREIIETCRHDEVLDCLRRVEQPGRIGGLHAAGFVSYEAAPAFDRALTVREAPGFPLAVVRAVSRGGNVALTPSRERHGCPPPPTRGPDGPAGPTTGSLRVAAGEYAAVIGRIREAIAAGETYQVNYTFRLRQPAAGDPWELFQDLVAAQRPPYAAYVETPDFAICSASPELFFELEGRRIVSRPMKGTIARGRWYEEDLARARELAASEKDRAENAMIVDMMRNDLGRIARVGSVAGERPVPRRALSHALADDLPRVGRDRRLAGRDLRRDVPLRVDHRGPEGQHDADHRPQRDQPAADLYRQHRPRSRRDAAPGSTWPSARCWWTRPGARPSMAWAAALSGTRRPRASMTSAC